MTLSSKFSLFFSIVVAFVAAETNWAWGGVQVSADGSTIYAYQYKNAGFVFRSRDSGKSFNQLDQDTASGYWGEGGIDANGTTIILGSTNAGGVIESLDGGETWHDVQSLPSYSDVHMYSAMAINDDGTEMYAGVSNSGPLFRKSGQGAWRRLNVPDKIPRNSVTCNSIDISKDGKNIYVADDDTESEILTSSDHGDTWSRIQVTNDESKLYPYSVAVAKEDPRTMVVGLTDFGLTTGALFVSTDAGQTFQDLRAQTQAIPFLSVRVSGDGKYMLAGSSNLWGSDSTPAEQRGKLFLSSDQGATWDTIELSESLPQGFDVSMSRDGKIMVAVGSARNQTKMFISNDYGQSWADADDRFHYD